ncbi:MAG TPA: ABC transporter permease, partial [Acidimicrobiales bacterium]
EPPGGPTIDAVLVGVTTAPEHLDDPTPAAYFSAALLEQPVGAGGTHMVVTLAPGATVDDLAAALESVPGHEELYFDSGRVVSDSLRDAVRAQAVGLAILTLVAGVAVVAALGQLFVRHLGGRAVEHRPLLALGYTRSQVLIEQVVWTALVGGTGAVIGTLGAALTSPLFPRGFVRQLDPDFRRAHLDPALLAVGCLLVAALLVAWVGVGAVASRRTPTGVRPSALADAVARAGLGPSAVTGVRFALGRARGGSSPRATLTTLGVGIAGVVASIVFAASVGRLVGDPARFGTNYDAVISNGFGSGPPAELPSLADDPAVRAATRMATTTLSADGGDVTIVGVDQVQGSLRPHVVNGAFPTAPDEIALGGVTARQHGLDIGDRMTLARGSGASLTYRLVGTVVMPAPSFGQGGGHGGAMLLSGLRRLEPDVEPDSLIIRFEPGTELPPTLHGFLLNRGSELPPPADVVNIDRARPVPIMLAVVIGALAALTLAHALITSVRRRRRDLAVLRSIGASRRWVGRVVHAQASALAGIAVVIGVPLGVFAGRLVFRAFAGRLGLVADPATPLAILAATVVAVLVIGNLSASVPAWTARRLSLPGLLRAE